LAHKASLLTLSLLTVLTVMSGVVGTAIADPNPCDSPNKGDPVCCGKGATAYMPSFSLGCQAKGNAILDLLFAVIRFLSVGAGLVIIASLVYAGIQYSASAGDPNAHATAVKRIRANVVALLIFVFAYAIVNYLVPGELLPK